MSFKDFMSHFDRLEICNLSPDSLEDDLAQGKTKWNMNILEGAWVAGETAGGCRNFIGIVFASPTVVFFVFTVKTFIFT